MDAHSVVESALLGRVDQSPNCLEETGRERSYRNICLQEAYPYCATHQAHASVKDGSYHIDQIFDGETVEEVLEYVQYNPKKLVRQLEIWVTKSVKQGKISLEEGKEFLSNYRSGLYGYTYLE